MYKPNPIDTSDVVLDNELIMLTEEIAENVHEVWSKGRIEDAFRCLRKARHAAFPVLFQSRLAS